MKDAHGSMKSRLIALAAFALGVAVARNAAAGPLFLWGEGTPRFGTPATAGPLLDRNAGSDLLRAQALASPTIPLWNGSFSYQGVTYPYTMVGTDPAAGSRRSVIRVAVVPLRFVFPGGTTLSATTPACGSTRSAVQLTKKSPLFTPHAFAPGGTKVGTTQYIDAYQRANFWSEVSTVSPNYHVKLKVSRTLPAQTITVPASAGKVLIGPCGPIGVVDIDFYLNALDTLFGQLPDLTPGVLPVFLHYDVFFSDTSGCCILGFHTAFSTTSGPQTLVTASFSDPGLFNVPIEDIHSLSHELGEWLADPLANNPVPGWTGGQATDCETILETGDPVTGVAFPIVKGRVTYHPEDLVFLPWFSRESPSSSVNGWYTFLNTYPQPAAVCH